MRASARRTWTAAIRFATRCRRTAIGRARGQHRLFPQRQGGCARRHARPYARVFRGRPGGPDHRARADRSGRPGRGRRGTGSRRDGRSISARAPSATRGGRGRSSPRPIRAATRSRSWRAPTTAAGSTFPAARSGITNFSHVALFSTDTKRDTEFWTRLVNARVSDWLGEATFLRIGTVHHSVVLMPSSRPGIQHINHQVEDIDDVMQSYYWLKQQGVKIVYGPGGIRSRPR